MKRYPPVPQMAKKKRQIGNVFVQGYEDGETYYIDFIASDGGGQKALEQLRKEFKRIVVMDPIATARGFWDKMLDRGLVDLLVHSVDFGDDRGEVMVPDDEIESLGESHAASKKMPTLSQAVNAYLRNSGLDPDNSDACFGTCKAHAHNLAQWLTKHGYEADVLQVMGPSKAILDKDMHPNWIGFLNLSKIARSKMAHYVVLVDDKIVDITGMQFGSKSGGVKIQSKKDYLANWDQSHETRRPQKLESAIVKAVREMVHAECYDDRAKGHKCLSVGDLHHINAPILSEMKVVKIGDAAPKHGWQFVAYRDRIWLVDPEKWKPSDGEDLYKILVKHLGEENAPDPKKSYGFYTWAEELSGIVDIFIGNYDPESNTITADHVDSPSFRSSPLVKKVVKLLGATTIDYETDVNFDRGQYIDTRDKLPKVMYHGTSSIFLDKILKEGLRPGNPSNWEGDNYHGTFKNHVFLTDSPIHARWHASDTARKQGGAGFVLQVRIPDPDKLTPDWDADSFSSSQQKTFQKINPKANSRSTVGSWKTSKAMGRFGYKGRIPASHIELEAWRPEGDDDGDWYENYPGDKYIWDLFTKYIKDDRFEDVGDAWDAAMTGGYDEEEDDLEEAMNPTAGSGFYFHGTTGELGRQILRDGFINPPDIGKRKAALTPRKGMVYLTPDIEYALGYALQGATVGYDFSQYADNWWWKNKGEAAIVRVKAEDMGETEPDEDDIADIIISHHWDNDQVKQALAIRIFKSYVEGDAKLEQKWKEVGYDPSLSKAVRLAKQILKKTPRSGLIWRDIKKATSNVAHPGRVKIHDVMFFRAPELSQIKRPKDGYTFELIASKVGDVEKPQISESRKGDHDLPSWFRDGKPISKEQLEDTAPDVPYILEGDEFNYAWKLCDVPLKALGIDPGMKVSDYIDRYLPDGSEESKKRMDKASSHPVIVLIEGGSPRLVDGWHRLGNAIASGKKTLKAVCAVADPEALTESSVDLIKNHRDEEVMIYENPSREQLAKITKHTGHARALIKGDKVYVFDANTLHQTVRSKSSLDLKDAISVVLWGEKGWIENVQVTDNNRHTKWHHSKELKDTILKVPYIRHRTKETHLKDEDFISYYDDAIVGPWHELEEAYTDFDSAPIDLLKHEQWRDLFFKQPSEKEAKAFRKFLRDNKEKQIVLYHGTSAKHKIMEQGLLPTTSKRRLSLQSASGYVYLSVYPGMAKSFAEMGYPKQEVVVYAVTLPIHKLSPDKDQLRNQRQWAGYEGKDDLAGSLLYGKGARFKGKIEPWRIKIEEGSPINEGSETTSSPILGGKLVEIDELPETTKDDIIQWVAENVPQLENDPEMARSNLLGLANAPKVLVGKVNLSSLKGWKERGVSDLVVKKYAQMTSVSEAPPILVAHGKFLDGGHRAHAYAKAKLDAIPAVDITAILDMDWDKWMAGDEYQPFVEDFILEGWEVAPIQDPRHYDQEATNGEDRYYYHVTSKTSAPSIIKHGLRPGETPMFDVFGKRSSGKVFLTDIDAVYFWMNAVKEKLKEKGSDDSVVLLRIPQKEVDAKNLQYDKRGSGESSGNDWYATKVIGAPETQNESVLLEGWEIAPDQALGDYNASEPDDYYYHVTSKKAAPGILKNGLRPGKPAIFKSYAAMNKGRVFLADKNGVGFWKGHVEDSLFANKAYNPADGAVVLRIPKSEVTAKLSVDKDGTDDSSANAWYATKVIGAPETQNESVLLEGWEVAPEQHPGDYRDVEPDDYYYHVTSRDAAPKILEHGLKPGMAALFTNYAGRTKGRVFLADKDGVDFWMEHVELHLFANKDYAENEDPANDVVVLRIPKKDVAAQLSVDKEGSEDSRAKAWYSTQLIENAARQIMYHVTTEESFAKIKKEGLTPACEMRGMYADEEDYEDRVYFFEDKNTADDGISAWMLDHPRFENEDKAILIGVDVTELDLEPDPELAGSYFTRDRVEPSRIISYEVVDLGLEENTLIEAKGRSGGWIGPVYHGSRHKFLKSLDVGQHGQGIVMVGGRQSTPAIYFTSSKENARFYADPKGDDDHDEYVYSAYVKLKNPLVVEEGHPLWKRHSPPQIATKAKAAGHDGFIIKDYTDGAVPSTIYGVFDNKNVRLVGPLKEPGDNLGTDSEIDPDEITVVDGDDGYYAFFQDEDGNMLSGPGPFKTGDEAEKEALRLVKKHNASLVSIHAPA